MPLRLVMTTALLLIGALALLIVGGFFLVRRYARAINSMSDEEFLERMRNLQH